VLVMRSGEGSCKVQIQLTDGTAYESSVSFHALGGCCPYTYAGSASAIEQVDAGSGG
jgi:hypothetical protein